MADKYAPTEVFSATIRSEWQGRNIPSNYEPGPSTEPPGTVVASRVASRTDNLEPELVWLASEDAKRYEGHWVALNAETGSFLGLADSSTQLHRWQAQGATIVFVEPPGFWAGA
jgi:hypothetical protein